jgi:tetratricopeptide (TPR) repeat protein
VRSDLVDLATILADLRTRWGNADGLIAANSVALEILRQAKEDFGPSPALTRDLRIYAAAAGRTDASEVPVPPPLTAWEHYDLGRSHLRSADYSSAERAFRRSIALRPEEFWPHYYHGICCYRLARFHDAVASLSTAIALAPQTAESYYNRALAYQALGRTEDALADNSRALDLRPSFADAALNRGILHFGAGKLAEALDDFDRARANASSRRMIGLVRYNEALVHLARKDAAAADLSLNDAVANGDEDARRLQDRLRAR